MPADVRFARRTLRKTPVLGLVAVAPGAGGDRLVIAQDYQLLGRFDVPMSAVDFTARREPGRSFDEIAAWYSRNVPLDRAPALRPSYARLHLPTSPRGRRDCASAWTSASRWRTAGDWRAPAVGGELLCAGFVQCHEAHARNRSARRARRDSRANHHRRPRTRTPGDGSRRNRGHVVGLALYQLVRLIPFDPNPAAPSLLVVAAGMILIIGVGACLAPVRRALAVDPASALRREWRTGHPQPILRSLCG